MKPYFESGAGQLAAGLDCWGWGWDWAGAGWAGLGAAGILGVGSGWLGCGLFGAWGWAGATLKRKLVCLKMERLCSNQKKRASGWTTATSNFFFSFLRV